MFDSYPHHHYPSVYVGHHGCTGDTGATGDSDCYIAHPHHHHWMGMFCRCFIVIVIVALIIMVVYYMTASPSGGKSMRSSRSGSVRR